MNQSEHINELASALAKAQGEMQAAIKDCINPFFKSKYADLGSIWDAARPVLSKNGLCIMQTTEMNGDKIIMVTTLAHNSGQWMKSHLPLNPSKNDSQGVGAAITYLRRYSLSALVGVVCDDDDDGETAMGRGKSAQNNPTTPPTPGPAKKNAPPVNQSVAQVINHEQFKQLSELMSNLDENSRNAFSAWYKNEFKCSKMIEIPKTAFDRCISALNVKIKFIKDQDRMVG